MLNVKDISFHRPGTELGNNVLDRLSLSIGSGEIVGIWGANGSGKTTLLKLIAGLLAPTSGMIEMTAKTLGMVFQDHEQNFFPWLTILQNVALPGLMRDIPQRQSIELARSALHQIGIPYLGARLPRSVSGGQRQLAALARWIAWPSDLLLIDEGWNMLDFLQRENVFLIFKQAIEKSGRSMVVVSHHVDDFASFCDRVVLISNMPATVKRQITLAPGDTPESRLGRIWNEIHQVSNA